MLQTVLAVAAVVILIAALWKAREALMLIYISALVAMGFAPLVQIIERPRARTRLPRWFAILAIYVTIVVVLTLVALAVVPPLVAQAAALWARMPEEFDHFQRFLIRYKLLRHPITLAEAVQNAPQGASAGAASAVGTVLAALSNLVGGIVGLITILILSFYLLVEAKTMFEYVSRFIPPARRGDVAKAAREAVVKVSAWLRAQFMLAGVMGTFAAIGLFIMGVPYFYVVALIAA